MRCFSSGSPGPSLQKPGVGGVVDAADAVRRDAHQVLHIAPGGVGDRDHAVGARQSAAEAIAAHLHPKAVVRYFVNQVGHVVNGHHVGPDHQQGNAVQGNVNKVGGEAPQKQRKRHVVHVRMVVAPVNGSPEVLRKPGQSAHVARSAHQRVLVCGIDRRQRMHQAADVCADAEVPDAPGVNDDVQRHS